MARFDGIPVESDEAEEATKPRFGGVPVEQEQRKPDAQARYDAALAKMRQEQFSDFDDEQWADYSGKFFAPYNMMNLAQQTQTFGFGDEINSAMGALGSQLGGRTDFGTAFGTYKELEEARRDLGREREGGLGVAAEIVGGLGIGAPVAAGAAPVAKTLGEAMIKGGAAAVPGAAVYGFGETDGDLGDRAKGAALTGVIGAATGVAAPVVARSVQKGVEAFANRATEKAAGVSGPARQVLTDALQSEGAFGPNGAARIQAAGPDGMLVDAGENTAQILDTAIQNSGAGGRVARDAIEGRATAANSQIQGAMDTAFGQPTGIKTAETRIRQGSAAARGSAYDTAYDSAIDYASDEGRRVEKLFDRIPSNVVAEANGLMRMDGHASRQLKADIADDGTVTFQVMPDVMQLDYIKRALNTAAESEQGLGLLGGMTTKGRVYSNLARDVRDATADAAPAYKTALETAADPIGRRQALLFGNEMMAKKTTREDVAEMVKGMTGPEKEAAKEGVRAHFDEALANVRQLISDPNIDARQAKAALDELSTPAAKQKLNYLLGKPETDAFYAQLDEARKAIELRGRVAKNSATFSRQNTDATVRDSIEGGVIAAGMEGKPLETGKRVVQTITGRTPEGKQKLRANVYEELATLLTQKRGAEAIELLNSLDPSQRALIVQQIIDSDIPIPPTNLTLSGGVAGDRAVEEFTTPRP